MSIPDNEITAYDRLTETQDIREQLYTWFDKTQDPYMTGFVGWEYKKRLIATQMYLEDLIARCPEYTPEPEWTEAQRVHRAMKRIDKS